MLFFVSQVCIESFLNGVWQQLLSISFCFAKKMNDVSMLKWEVSSCFWIPQTLLRPCSAIMQRCQRQVCWCNIQYRTSDVILSCISRHQGIIWDTLKTLLTITATMLYVFNNFLSGAPPVLLSLTLNELFHLNSVNYVSVLAKKIFNLTSGNLSLSFIVAFLRVTTKLESQLLDFNWRADLLHGSSSSVL